MGDARSRIRGALQSLGLAVAGVLALVLLYSFATQFLAPDTSPVRPDTTTGLIGDIVQVEVLNGCGEPGVAGEVTQFLRDHDFDVVSSGNYVDFDQAQSLVIDRVGNREVALRVAAILGIDEAYVREDIGDGYYVDASVVIGRDYPSLPAFAEDAAPFSLP